MDCANPYFVHNISLILYKGYSYYLCTHVATVALVHFQHHVIVMFMINKCGSDFICSDLKCLETTNYLQCLSINNFFALGH